MGDHSSPSLAKEQQQQRWIMTHNETQDIKLDLLLSSALLFM